VSMNSLETGTLFIKSKVLEETHDHISRLSIRFMLNGDQHYKVGGNEVIVNPENYLVVNQGQHYKTSFSSHHEQEMILVAFKPGFAESLRYSLLAGQGILLDDPFASSMEPVHFFEKTYEMDHIIHHLIHRLRDIFNRPLAERMDTDFDSIYEELLSRMIRIHAGINGELDKFKAVKRSTRIELYKRLNIAKDFMHANLGRKINLEIISGTASLSVHHFKREFKTLFGYTPHRYLFLKRMEKARQLLKESELPVNEIALNTGFIDQSSFIRQFRKLNGITPGDYRTGKKG
jgi:AraC family transcriptional regulator